MFSDKDNEKSSFVHYHNNNSYECNEMFFVPKSVLDALKKTIVKIHVMDCE